MTYVTTQPRVIADAAAELGRIRSAMAAASAAASGPTTSLLAAAEDEVSTALATLFGAYAQEYQAVAGQASMFHDAFARALAGAENAYASAEATNAALTAGSAAAGSTTAASAAPALLANPFVALIMQGSGISIPTVPYMKSVEPYIRHLFGVPADLLPLTTPEGLYPLTQIKDLPLSQSVSTGVAILDNALYGPQGLISQQHLNVNVLGYSQSAVISSLEMRHLVALGSPNTDNLTFTLLGNPMTPNGGLMSRFAGLTLPSLGLDFYGAMPTHTGYQSNSYAFQYDGYADFPRYPINLLADINAFAGIQYVHGNYPDLNPAALPAGYHLVHLPSTDPLNNFYMVTYPNLPILEPLRALPVLGNPLADLIQPDLTYLINLGYGDYHYGYSTGYADVATPFGLFPSVDPVSFAGDMVTGAQQGAGAFVSDIAAMGAPSPTGLLSSLTTAFGPGGTGGTGGTGLLPSPSLNFSPDGFIQTLKTLNTDITNNVTNVSANLYAIGLPTADIANAMVTSLPSYDVNLFLDGVQRAIDGDPVGGLSYAFGAPIAANTALLTLAGGFELNVILNTIGEIAGGD